MSKWMVGLVIIIVIGTFLRFYNINLKEFWYDEAFTAHMSDNSFTDILDLSKKDVHPPLYYLLVTGWTKVFGQSDFGFRSLSVLFGILLIPITYWLVNILTDSKIKALSISAVIAVNPFMVTYSKEARSYSMFVFLFALTLVVLFTIRKKRSGWSIMSILLPVFFLTHYVSIFALPLIILLLPRERKTLFVLLPLAITVYLQLPAMLALRQPFEWAHHADFGRVVQSTQAFLFGIYHNNTAILRPNIIVPCLPVLLLVLIAWYVLKQGRNHFQLLILSVVPIISVAIVCSMGKYFLYLERYLIPFGYALVIYVGIIVSTLPKKLPIVVLVLYLSLSSYLILNYTPQNVGYKNTAQYMDSLDKKVILADATEYLSISRYSEKVRLQDGDWSNWAIINDGDILVKEESKPFYLVSRKEIGGWEHAYGRDGFFYYEW